MAYVGVDNGSVKEYEKPPIQRKYYQEPKQYNEKQLITLPSKHVQEVREYVNEKYGPGYDSVIAKFLVDLYGEAAKVKTLFERQNGVGLKEPQFHLTESERTYLQKQIRKHGSISNIPIIGDDLDQILRILF